MTFVTHSIWLSVTGFVILKVAFHTGDKCFTLNSSSVTFFTLIAFRSAFNMIVFVVFLLLLLAITCLATPKWSFICRWAFFNAWVMIIIFTKITLNYGSVSVPPFAFFTNFYLVSGLNKFLLISIFEFSFDFIDESMNIFDVLLWRHIFEIIFQHANIGIEVD